MREILTFALSGAFAAIGLLHLWWARKPMRGDLTQYWRNRELGRRLQAIDEQSRQLEQAGVDHVMVRSPITCARCTWPRPPR